jgi:hypothetical protein
VLRANLGQAKVGSLAMADVAIGNVRVSMDLHHPLPRRFSGHLVSGSDPRCFDFVHILRVQPAEDRRSFPLPHELVELDLPIVVSWTASLITYCHKT